MLIPAAFFGGATFLILADLVARLILSPMELPVGVMTAFIGAPVFVTLLRKSSGESE
jgi:iron complex transport system permease protein